MRIILLSALSIFSICNCVAQSPDDWTKLLDAHKYDEAATLCTGWEKSGSLSFQIEAEKCLTNVELARGQSVQLMGNDFGGGTLGGGYTPEAIEKALVHLNRGIELAPQDLSIHQGRLHILEVSGRFDEMATALDESASIYKGSDALESWLAYDFELSQDGQARVALHLAEILNRHYPDNHEVIGNIGALYDMLDEWDAGLPFLKRAVDLAPSDSLDNWNLGWAYKHFNMDSDADKWMSQSIRLDPSGKQMPEAKCLYAEFVDTHLHEKARACSLEKASCKKADQEACAKEKH